MMLHDNRIYQTASYMDMAKICDYPFPQHALLHQKYSLHCCADCPRISIPIQELDSNNQNTCPTMRFHL